ncbi:MAG: hypothetical protein AB8B96_03605 [Lysobacterales bacterium]
MNSYPHPNPGCDLAGHGRSNPLLITVFAAIVGGAAGLLLVPVVLGIIILAILSLGITRLTQWLTGILAPPGPAEPSLPSKL